MSKHYEPGLYILRRGELCIEECDVFGVWLGIGNDVEQREPPGTVIAGPFSPGQLLKALGEEHEQAEDTDCSGD